MSNSARNNVLKVSVAFLAVPMFYFVFNQYRDLFNCELILSKLNIVGLSALLTLIPYFCIILSDSFGWKHSFGKIKNQISFVKLFLLRLATEALQTSLPGGAFYAEIVRPFLLKKYFKLEYSDSISANIIAKVNILFAQTLFFILGVGMFAISLRDRSFVLSLPEYLLYPALVIAAFFPILVTYMLYRKNLLIIILDIFNKVNFRPLKNFISKINPSVIRINETISIFSRLNKRDLGLTIIFFFSTWILMAIESLIILRMIRASADIFQVILIESLISFVRMIFFFIPGAVGPQDVVIVILFNLVGISDPQSNAIVFVLLKRAKEFIWIVTGYILLLLIGVRPFKLILSKKIELTPVKETL